MNRRIGGLLIVVLVMLVAVIIPGAWGRSMPGIAALAPIPGPPAVGDCLTAPESSGWDQGAGATYAPQRLSACHGSRYGEVVAVIHDARSRKPVVPRIQTPADGSAGFDGSAMIADPNHQSCSDGVSRYLGLQLDADHTSTISGGWAPVAPEIELAPAGPSTLQKEFGQDWVACVVFLADDDLRSMAYPTSLKDAYRRGEVPAELALCVGSADIAAAEAVSCIHRHPAEAFGVMTTDRPGLTQRSLDVSCRTLVMQVTRLPDPTVGGQLQVEAAAAHVTSAGRSVAGLGRPDDQTGFAGCLVVAPTDHELGGSVLGLHGSPIPWAP